MKEYCRENPLFSLCGLNCGLCPVHHMDKGCPGCGGGEGHQSCAIVRCSQRHGCPEYCNLCEEFPCEKYETITECDSFISHRNMLKDLRKASGGIEEYLAELREKVTILRTLLENYNDGRRKTFYCTAVNLLDIRDIRRVMIQILDGTTAGMSEKEQAEMAAGLLQNAADERQISLKLRRKKSS